MAKQPRNEQPADDTATMGSDESTSRTITVAGREFTIPQRYKEGDTLKANEALALNRTLAENARNNFAKRVKDAGDGASQDDLQRQFDEYVNSYEFGTRQGGGRVADPVRREAILIATNSIKAKLQKEGRPLKDFTSQQLREAAERAVEQNPKFMEVARRRVEEAQSLAV